MTKPDDIPQDVWERSWQLYFDEVMVTAGKPDVPALIARAIMAERAACACASGGEGVTFAMERMQMAEDWCRFCEAIGVDVDTHEAVAETILSRMALGSTEGHSTDDVGFADAIVAAAPDVPPLDAA